MAKSKVVPVLLVACALGFLPAQASARDIHWRYTDPASLRVNPLYEVLVDGVQLNLQGYARYRYGSTASVFLASNDAYGWRIRYLQNGSWRTTGIDMLAVVQWQGMVNYGYGRMKNWGVYYTQFGSPYSWRGIYILRIR